MILSTVCSLLLLIVQCHGKLSPRIYHGQPAPPGKFPYVTALVIPDEDNRLFAFCGGAIISELWILTAAHCINADLNPFDFDVLVGTYNLDAGGILKKPEFKIPHENFYDGNGDFHDIGLIKLKDPIHFNQDTGRVLLPTQDIVRDNCTTYSFAGWGLTEFEGPHMLPRDLRHTNMSYYSSEACNRTSGIITENNFCAVNNLGHNPCSGDSGSPLVSDSDQAVYGINSSGGGFNEPDCMNFPAVFTNVYKYLTWITVVMDKFK